MEIVTSPAFFTHLSAEYTPELVTFTIKIMPSGEVSFDVPPEEIIAQLGPCLKYMLARFSGKCGPGTTPVSPQAPGSRVSTRALDRAERKDAAMGKMLKGGATRALEVLEHDLKLAQEGKDPDAIARAENALKAGKAYKETIGKE